MVIMKTGLVHRAVVEVSIRHKWIKPPTEKGRA